MDSRKTSHRLEIEFEKLRKKQTLQDPGFWQQKTIKKREIYRCLDNMDKLKQNFFGRRSRNRSIDMDFKYILEKKLSRRLSQRRLEDAVKVALSDLKLEGKDEDGRSDSGSEEYTTRSKKERNHFEEYLQLKKKSEKLKKAYHNSLKEQSKYSKYESVVQPQSDKLIRGFKDLRKQVEEDSNLMKNELRRQRRDLDSLLQSDIRLSSGVKQRNTSSTNQYIQTEKSRLITENKGIMTSMGTNKRSVLRDSTKNKFVQTANHFFTPEQVNPRSSRSMKRSIGVFTDEIPVHFNRDRTKSNNVPTSKKNSNVKIGDFKVFTSAPKKDKPYPKRELETGLSSFTDRSDRYCDRIENTSDLVIVDENFNDDLGDEDDFDPNDMDYSDKIVRNMSRESPDFTRMKPKERLDRARDNSKRKKEIKNSREYSDRGRKEIKSPSPESEDNKRMNIRVFDEHGRRRPHSMYPKGSRRDSHHHSNSMNPKSPEKKSNRSKIKKSANSIKTDNRDYYLPKKKLRGFTISKAPRFGGVYRDFDIDSMKVLKTFEDKAHMRASIPISKE